MSPGKQNAPFPRVLLVDELRPPIIMPDFVSQNDFPPIPFSRERLARGANSETLILEWPYGSQGQQFILSELGDDPAAIVGGTHWNPKSKRRFFEMESWYRREDFFNKPVIDRPTWKLVTPLLSESNTDCLSQTQVLVKYLCCNAYPGGRKALPPRYLAAVDEFYSLKDAIQTLLFKYEYSEATDLLFRLEMNRLFRESVESVAYRTLLSMGTTGICPLSESYLSTKSRSLGTPRTSIIRAGDFSRGGLFFANSPDFQGKECGISCGVCYAESAENP